MELNSGILGQAHCTMESLLKVEGYSHKNWKSRELNNFLTAVYRSKWRWKFYKMWRHLKTFHFEYWTEFCLLNSDVHSFYLTVSILNPVGEWSPPNSYSIMLTDQEKQFSLVKFPMFMSLEEVYCFFGCNYSILQHSYATLRCFCVLLKLIL